jgi:hypothetical protein
MNAEWEEANPSTKSRVSNPTGANIRSTPEFASNILFYAKPGDVLRIDGPAENDFFPLTVWVHKTMVVPDSEIPYISQWSMTANITTADCGEACVLMLAKGNGKAKQLTVDDCVTLLNNAEGWTSPADLVELGRLVGLPLVQSGSIKDQSICLINYAKVPVSMKQDVNFKGLHWVLVTKLTGDRVIYHDPDFWGNDTWKGANRDAHVSDFNTWYAGVSICKG